MKIDFDTIDRTEVYTFQVALKTGRIFSCRADVHPLLINIVIIENTDGYNRQQLEAQIEKIFLHWYYAQPFAIAKNTLNIK